MEVAPSLCFPVTEASQVGDARRNAVRLAEARGLDATTVGRVALVVTELAGNLVKHTAAGGQVVIRALDDSGVEVLALDRGPGMENVARSLQDGYSTAGSPGTGLGAVARQSALFQVFSSPGLGTAILSRVGAASAAEDALEVGAVSVPFPGEEVNGDGWAAVRRESGLSVLVVDGLGHGPGAAEASNQAILAFRGAQGLAPPQALERIHAGMRGTRGGAVAVARLDPCADELRFAGVGNIAASVLSGGASRSMISHNGIVGHQMQRVQEFTYPLPPGAVLILHSDGLTGRWDLSRYPGLLSRHAALIAGVLFRDFSRGSDDATVAVVRRSARCGPAGS